MSNSVVKVTDITDDMLNDSLLLLVGEDGTVTPDQQTVETYLSSKTVPTNIQIMTIDKSDPKGIDVSINHVKYIPDTLDMENEEKVDAVIPDKEQLQEIARNLYNFKLDHDYTPLTSPRQSSPVSEEDELTKTLSILHGSDESEPDAEQVTGAPILISVPPAQGPPQKTESIPVAKTEQTPVAQETPSTASTPVGESGEITSKEKSVSKEDTNITTPVTAKTRPKVIHTQPKSGTKAKRVNKKVVQKEDEKESDSDDFEDDEDFDVEMEDENDSDFNIEEEIKGKQPPKRSSRRRTRSESKSPVKTPKISPRRKAKKEPTVPPPKLEPKRDKSPEKLLEKPPDPKPEPQETKLPEKKPPKKEKKTPKPLPDDFALFSTPDIIRRVGGKEPTTPVTPESPNPPKPAKITQESRSKSNSESSFSHQAPTKQNRSSVDGKTSTEKEKHEKEKHSHHQRTSTDSKSGDRRMSTDSKSKRTSVDEKFSKPLTERLVSESTTTESKLINAPSKAVEKNEDSEVMETIPSAEDIRSIIMNEDTKSYTTNSMVIPDLVPPAEPIMDQNNINLDAAGLDLDQSILDNINNDMISEDILYQVAQQLVSNTELQNAIDKGINEGVLDTSGIQEPMEVQQIQDTSTSQGTSESDLIKEGTQIIRPGGRIVVIPPIERPTTRSRNKRKEENKPPFKSIHKPLDEEHVSGNELDSSNDEEESEDDPNKLWCICNQPHNNRFMICCDTCEEWYHGKCVNITKAMGQQMESEGKEWICLFCKDSSLRRPAPAARRIRKASRNSRASTDSNNSTSKKAEGSPTSVPCVVCQKPARKNSIYCSEGCILAHAQKQTKGMERVVVFDRSSGKMLTGSRAPSAAGLDQWLKENPGFEVVRSTGKVVTTSKPGPLTQTKLKLVKNTDNNGISLAVQQKGVSLGVLKHSPKHSPKYSSKPHIKVFKIITKQVNPKEPKTKLIQPQPIPAVRPSAQPATPSKPPKTVQTVLTPKTPKSKETPKEKAMPSKTPKSRQQEQPSSTPQPKQENIRENVQKTISEQLTVRLKGIEDIKLTEDEVKSISAEIESQMYKCFGDTGQKYKNKYRSLIFNIKDTKNQTLWRRICEKSISPYELVRLSPDDMASQELAMWREREAKHQLDMIKKSELELLNCNRQYVLKTHKGEQVLEDGRPDKVDNTEVIKSLTEGSALDSGEKDKRDSSKERHKDKGSTSKHSHKDKDRDRERKLSKDRKDKDHRSHRSSSRDKDRDRSRKRSRSRDHGHGSSRHGDKKREKKSRSKSRDRDRHRKSSHKSSRHKKDITATTDKLDKKSKEILDQLVDSKIVPPLEDRLWKHVPQEDIVPGKAPMDSDSDHEPSSTVTIPTPPRSQEMDEFQMSSQSSSDSKASSDKQKKNVEPEERSTSPPPKSKSSEIWRGTINMIDVAQLSITAHEVSGDCSILGSTLSENLDIVGRISPETVWDYIGKMKCSNSKIISLVRLNAINVEEKMPYLALYGYLSSRNRLGVVKSTSKAVKDFYILPLASTKPIPQALLPINGPGFEEPRPALLLGIIVRDKRKRSILEPATPPVVAHKKTKVDVAIVPPPPTVPPRSYTPPPVPPPHKSDPRLTKLPMPPVVEPEDVEGGDEPYSPEDSDPDIAIVEPTPVPMASTSTAPTATKPLEEPVYPAIPGLGDTPILPSSKSDIEKQMEELNKEIEMQKSEITSITKNIATADIGTSALASIALPSNLQQILDSIKTIGAVSSDTVAESDIPGADQTNLTIPLMIPKTFTRPLTSSQRPKMDAPNDTIPLNLPNKPKVKPASINSPLYEADKDKSGSVLSTLSEEDLIKKAAEMLGEEETSKRKMDPKNPPPAPVLRSPSPKKPKVDSTLPPVPGIDE